MTALNKKNTSKNNKSKEPIDFTLPVGKLDNSLLDKFILKKIKTTKSDILLDGSIGGDCSKLKLKKADNVLVISTDPITATKKEIGSLAIQITANDIATEGIKPNGILLTMLLPKGTKLSELKLIIEDAISESKKLSIPIIGGHTEITPSVNLPIISATALGTKREKKLESFKDKDIFEIFVSKHIGIEGSYIISKEKETELKKILTAKEIKKLHSLNSQLSVIREGILCSELAIKMHDITEGGILGAAYEVGNFISAVSNKNICLNIYEEKIPLLSETVKISTHFKIDPLKLISSGSMMIVCKKHNSNSLVKKFHNNKIKITKVGEISFSKKTSLNLTTKNEAIKEIKEPKSDEIYKIV